MILNFYYTFYFSDIEACQGLRLFPQCDVMNVAMTVQLSDVKRLTCSNVPTMIAVSERRGFVMVMTAVKTGLMNWTAVSYIRVYC